ADSALDDPRDKRDPDGCHKQIYIYTKYHVRLPAPAIYRTGSRCSRKNMTVTILQKQQIN
ncbi:hypothetical protein LZ189_09705, partial [Rhodovulum sulfidophilum]|nr:hypothetical protein [Rhodovulum sulfidophilum]